jgi:hypothetical protein
MLSDIGKLTSTGVALSLNGICCLLPFAASRDSNHVPGLSLKRKHGGHIVFVE